MTADTQPPPQPKRKRRVSVCVGCGSQIQDQFILRVAPDLEWHASCLKCADCNQHLDESCTCFVKDGKTYCRRDYTRIFGAKCGKCNQSFGKSDFVMRARNKVYHIDCFRCVACSRQLIPGDEFAIRDDELFCKADHDVVERSCSKENGNGSSEEDSPKSSKIRKINNDDNNNNNNSNEISKNGLHLAELLDVRTELEEQFKADKKYKSVKVQTNEQRYMIDFGIGKSGEKALPSSVKGRAEQVSSGKGGGLRSHSIHKNEQKPTRVRTVLNEKQLHTLRTCYNANPRPDALMKEQLVEMTGLSPRVIRVWFQNKRCKDKKRSIMMKQIQQQQQEKNGGRLHGPLQGVPMVASSPVRHESPMQANAVEVQSYQPPWKALSDFAMQSELEHPPFQQLMNSFDTMDSDDTSPYPNEIYSDGYGSAWISGEMHDGNISDSECGESPSEMSSPLSQ